MIKKRQIIDTYYLSIQPVLYSAFIITLNPEILDPNGILTVAFAVRLLKVAMLLTMSLQLK